MCNQETNRQLNIITSPRKKPRFGRGCAYKIEWKKSLYISVHEFNAEHSLGYTFQIELEFRTQREKPENQEKNLLEPEADTPCCESERHAKKTVGILWFSAWPPIVW